jgi:multiple sugar transport system substrate-binding protein
MDNPDTLIDFKDYFNDDELSAYIPSFLEEGEIDHRLVVFPTAKSTEIMFINKTLFDRFAEDTGGND